MGGVGELNQDAIARRLDACVEVRFCVGCLVAESKTEAKPPGGSVGELRALEDLCGGADRACGLSRDDHAGGKSPSGLRRKLPRVDGSTHVNDSSELSFKVAARKCFAEAANRANPHLLEPVMRVEASTPPEALGDVMGDLGARRGKVTSLGEVGARRIVVANVPLAEMFGYAGALRSLSSGRGTFNMEFETYQAVPETVAARVLRESAA